MRSREFFGNYKFIDISVELYNAVGDLIYVQSSTTFAHAKPIIKRELDFAIKDYKQNYVYNGEPTKAEIFTSPSFKLCTIDLVTNKKTYK